ncbi:MAG: hypothetical protein IPN69_20965 [Acidobacteria bacterium]|nr:hypothetical protein [Acidobacteriota bacterium]MBK8148530.1 hypothetical protein [Acidobacteriota bacterium]MBK8813180.1 hypothetical protein [Acidobacteriota bacterium]
MKRKFALLLVFGTMLVGSLQMIEGVSAQSRLTLAMILTGLQTKGTTPETSTLAKRNVYIQRKVEASGVTFRLTPDLENELRNAGATPTLIAAIRRAGPTTVQTPTPTTTGRPRAIFKNLWIDYDVTEGGQIGMRIHVKFTTLSMRSLDSYLAIYFTNSAGAPLKDRNDKFNSSSGDVAVYREMKPGYDSTDYDDLTVFMPYDELDLNPGKYTLGMDVKIIYKAGGLIQDLTKKAFEYTKSDVIERDSESVSATVNRVWIDYNVTQGGKRGMLIHVSFEVTGLQGIDSALAVRVMKTDGGFLPSSSSGYSNDDDELEILYAMKPGYPTSVFKDATVFLPYNEIVIGKGKWDLKLDFDLKYEDGELIKHLDVYEFEFTRN